MLDRVGVASQPEAEGTVGGMARIFKTTYPVTARDGQRTRRKSKKWYISYRDEHGTIRRVAGFTDKSATLQRAAELELNVERRQVGLTSELDEHRRRPLSEHLADWHKSLIDKGTTRKHADLVKCRAERIVKDCRFFRWSDISASAVQGFLATLRDEDLSAQTRNFYLGAIKQFFRWLVLDRRAETNPLQHLQAENVRVDRRHDRVDFSVEELHRLLAAAAAGPTIRHVPGPERALSYRLAAETGLRADEVRSLTVGSFRLMGKTPTVHKMAAQTKNRQEAELPIRRAFASVLCEHFRGKLPGARAFKMPSEYDVARVLRKDMAAARAAWIAEAQTDEARYEREGSDFLAYQDADGRFKDFQALRHTFGTMLKRAGVHPKDTQLLMRHSTITLTMDRYTHGLVGDLAAAVEALPDVSTGPTREVATGTLGKASNERVAAGKEADPDSLHGALHGALHCVDSGSAGSQRVISGTPIVSPIGTTRGVEADPTKAPQTPVNTREVDTRGQRMSGHDTEKNRQPPNGLEPLTCGLQNRCSTD